MAEPEGPQAPPIPEGAPDPQAPQDPPAPSAPHAPQVFQAPQQPILLMLPLDWSHFKPKFSRKPDKMQKHIYLGQRIGLDFRTMMKFKAFV